MYGQVEKLKVSINETIASGTRAVNKIYARHQRLDNARRQELIEQTERTFDVAADVLEVCDIATSQLHEHSDDLPHWVNCFKQFIHYRQVMLYCLA